LIEIYKSVDAAFLLRDNLDHVQISDLIKETVDLRQDPKIKKQKEVEDDWKRFKQTEKFKEEFTLPDGTKTSISDLMSFDKMKIRQNQNSTT